MLKGFRNFMSRGDIVVVAVGLVIALAMSTLIKAFSTSIIFPLVNRAQGDRPIGLGVQLGASGNTSTFVDFGSFISAIIYFVIFMAVVYFAIVVPFRRVQARRGITIFGDPPRLKTCPYCLSDDLPVDATKCKHCASDLDSPDGPQPVAVSAVPGPPVS